MGAVDYLPYAHSKTDVEIPIWNGAHTIIDQTTGANVTCELQRLNGLWYKLATRADNLVTSIIRLESAWLAAAATSGWS